jgi:LPS O-antigen subunit length determinant protein (WzzB/FepE family)
VGERAGQKINQEVKQKDQAEANSAIAYLSQQLESTQLVEMQRVFYDLIESQTRISMLTDVREEYVFQVVDPAVVPDQKIAPRRSLIAVLGTMLGAMLALVVVLVRHYAFSANEGGAVVRTEGLGVREG